MSVWALVVDVRGAGRDRPEFADVAATELDAIYRFLLHFTRDATLAEDLTSATFERALRDWHRYDPRKGRPRTWLVEIARNQALDHFRSERRREARERRAAIPDDHHGGIGVVGGLPPDLRAALGTLSDTEREIVALRVILDFDTDETARVLGISRTNVSTGLHRALGRLRKRMAAEGTP